MERKNSLLVIFWSPTDLTSISNIFFKSGNLICKFPMRIPELVIESCDIVSLCVLIKQSCTKKLVFHGTLLGQNPTV